MWGSIWGHMGGAWGGAYGGTWRVRRVHHIPAPFNTPRPRHQLDPPPFLLPSLPLPVALPSHSLLPSPTLHWLPARVYPTPPRVYPTPPFPEASHLPSSLPSRSTTARTRTAPSVTPMACRRRGGVDERRHRGEFKEPMGRGPWGGGRSLWPQGHGQSGAHLSSVWAGGQVGERCHSLCTRLPSQRSGGRVMAPCVQGTALGGQGMAHWRRGGQ